MDDAIYLDHNATTPVDLRVLETITDTLKDVWADPSAAYAEGCLARSRIDSARKQILTALNAPCDSRIVFTSSGTEANHLVFNSILCTASAQPHIILSAGEHPSVMHPATRLSQSGAITLTQLPLTSDGQVAVSQIWQQLRYDTRLVSVILAHNETGVVNDLRTLVRNIRAWESMKPGRRKVYIHTNAAQALGKIPVDVADLDVDYMTIVGHKLYGPRMAALYARADAPLEAMFFGGGQEDGFRSGTENTAMIVGLAKAVELATSRVYEYSEKTRNLVRTFQETMSESSNADIKIRVFGSGPRLPNTLLFCICGMAADGSDHANYTASKLVKHADKLGVMIGHVCDRSEDGNLAASRTLAAMNVDNNLAMGAVRVSFGFDNTEDEAHIAAQKIWQAYDEMT